MNRSSPQGIGWMYRLPRWWNASSRGAIAERDQPRPGEDLRDDPPKQNRKPQLQQPEPAHEDPHGGELPVLLGPGYPERGDPRRQPDHQNREHQSHQPHPPTSSYCLPESRLRYCLGLRSSGLKEAVAIDRWEGPWIGGSRCASQL